MRVVGGSDLEGSKGPAQPPGGQHSRRGSTRAREHAEGGVGRGSVVLGGLGSAGNEVVVRN